MAVNSNEEFQNTYDVAFLPEECITNLQSESQPVSLTVLEVPSLVKTQLYMGALSSCQNYVDVRMENADVYSPCIVDVDIEKAMLQTPKKNEENFKTEDPLSKALQREVSFRLGGKIMQLLVDHSFVLPKFTSRDKCAADRVYDPANSRSRKYKRSTSFNSRKVALLFSVLSSVGTMILIYLTLRVRLLGDGSAHV